MNCTLRFDDLARFEDIIASGFDDWGDATEIDEACVASFALVTGVEASDNKLPGCLLQSLLPSLVPPPCWSVEGHSGAINLGSPHTRYPAAAHAGAHICGRRRLANASSHPRGTLLAMEFELRTESSQMLCLRTVIEVLYLKARS